MRRITFYGLIVVLSIGAASALHAQLIVLPDVLSVLGAGGDPMASSPYALRGEYPGLGHKFVLFGTATQARDPENADNEVILVSTAAPPTFGGAERSLGAGVKIQTLDNRIQLKYYFVPPHTCGVGTPRVFLTIDRDGDGQSDGNAFGYIGAPPQFGPCVTGKWLFEDLTDDLPRWDLTQFGGSFYNTWTQVEAFFAAFPNHRVLTGGVVDDTSNPLVGNVYFDLFTVHNRSLENWQDSVR